MFHSNTRVYCHVGKNEKSTDFIDICETKGNPSLLIELNDLDWLMQYV